MVVEGQAIVERDGRILGNDGIPAVIGSVALAGCPHNATVTAVTDMRLFAFDLRTYARLRREGLLKSVAHRLEVVVREQQRLERCTPIEVNVLAGIL